MKATMRAIILAAGRGERMRPLTDGTPKPLLRAGGKALIEYHLEKIAACDIREVVINTAWLGEKIPMELGDGSRWGVKILYSHEGWPALETGGGIFNALPLLGEEPFLVVSGDVWTDYPFNDLRIAASDVAHVVVVPNPDFYQQGDFGLSNGRVIDGAEVRYTYANIGLFRSEFFAGLKPGRFPLGPLIFDWARKRRVSGELYRGRWRNVGTPAQLAELDAQLRTDQ